MILYLLFKVGQLWKVLILTEVSSAPGWSITSSLYDLSLAKVMLEMYYFYIK